MGHRWYDEAETARKKNLFLEAYQKTGAIYLAADAVGIDRNTPRVWKKKDPDFKKRMEQAFEANTQYLEWNAYKQAVSGKAPVMLIFLLKSRRPGVYGDKAQEGIGRGFSLADFITLPEREEDAARAIGHENTFDAEVVPDGDNGEPSATARIENDSSRRESPEGGG